MDSSGSFSFSSTHSRESRDETGGLMGRTMGTGSRDLPSGLFLLEDDSLDTRPYTTKAATAASATAMSCSTVPAPAPTAPMMLPLAMMGMPPPKMTTLPALLS